MRGVPMSSTFGLFNTSIMGMSAQASALADISENIANSGTTGYKRASTQFLTVLSGYQGSGQSGGGVEARTRFDIAQQGAMMSTGSATDIAIHGNGFFVVNDESGSTLLTRAGSFVPDAKGRLVNGAGYVLMGFPIGSAGSSSTSNSALANMEPVVIHNDQLFSKPTTSGTLAANLPAGAAIVAAANLPSTNSASTIYSAKTSLTTYDNLGAPVTFDIYFAKTADNTFEMTAYNSADAASGGFPYQNPGLATQTLTFDPANGSLTAGSPFTFTVPNGAAVTLDLSETTQLGAPFAVNNVTVNGNAPSAISHVEIASNGTLSYLLDDGEVVPAYMIGLANVDAPTKLTNCSGNAYAVNGDSGPIFVGTPTIGGFGHIQASTLEASTVDLATELSSMIIAQRSYTANTQSFQVASEILQVLNNLK